MRARGRAGRSSAVKSRRRRRWLRPRSWPVRWRLAGVSAGLTLAILLAFGVTVGQVATERIRSDFDKEVQGSAQSIASEVRTVYTPLGTFTQLAPTINRFLLPEEGAARVLDREGIVRGATGADAGDLGPLEATIGTHDGMRVAVAAITTNGELSGYIQYGRSLEHVESTISRLWLLVVGGVLAGTLLASLAGVAIASRAMRPIGALTATARRIASTRDPSLQMPSPTAEDEVGELTRTLEEMLRALDAARAEREGAMQKQREFVADASHELRTPLTSVLANLELLQASLEASHREEDREVLDSALRSSRRMSRLVADLLLLARADAGRLGRHRRCDLAEVAGEAAAEAAPLLGERRLSLDNARPLRVDGNPDELHRMILNLLDNAARYTPPRAHVELRLRQETGSAIVEVGDDGPGIPPEARRQIFDRFVRGEGPADTAAGHGTGLGLAIVSAVAASHGGEVAVEESASGGALFRIRIPLAAGSRPLSGSLEGL